VVDSTTSIVYSSALDAGIVSSPSQGFHANGTKELGDTISLEGDSRVLDSVTVGLNSWSCETGQWNLGDCVTTDATGYSHPVTVNVYDVNPTDATVPGALLATKTQNVQVPFRPSSDPVLCPSNTTGWYDAAGGACQNGFAFDADFDLSADGVMLPDTVILAVAYDTNKTVADSDPSGFSNTLNVGLTDAAPGDGTDLDSAQVMISTAPAQGGTGSLKASTPEDGLVGYTPVFTVTASPVAPLESYLNGFEDAADTSMNLVPQVASDTDGVTAAAGCFYGAAPVTNYGTHGTDGFVNTRFAGYTDMFPEGGWNTSTDFYVDTAKTGQFQWSVAANGSDGSGQRDFVFTVGNVDAAGVDTGTWQVGVSNSAATSAPLYFGDYTNPVTITDSGWYTVVHEFTNIGGVLTAEMKVIDASGGKLGEWDVSNSADTIPAEVGGNRYGWLVNNSIAGLPIDNILLNADHPTAGCGDDCGTGTDASTTTASTTLGNIGFSVTGTPAAGKDLIDTVSLVSDVASVGALPAGVTAPYGAASFELAVETGSTATVTLGLPSPVTTLYKHLGAAWVEYPATISGNTVTFEVVDGGAGDADGVAKGVIVDPAAPALEVTFTG